MSRLFKGIYLNHVMLHMLSDRPGSTVLACHDSVLNLFQAMQKASHKPWPNMHGLLPAYTQRKPLLHAVQHHDHHTIYCVIVSIRTVL